MEVDYRNNPQGSYMVRSHPETSKPDLHSLQMVLKNRIPGLLKTEQEIMNGKVRLLYDITAMRSFADMMAEEKITKERFCILISDLKNCAKGVREYLLDMDQVLFSPEAVYWDQDAGRFLFCLDPFFEGDYQTEIRELFDRILENIEYEDPDYVKIVYELHSLVRKDHFRISELSEAISRAEGNETVNIRNMFDEIPEEKKTSGFTEERLCNEMHPESREREETASSSGFFGKMRAYMQQRSLRDVVSDIDSGVFLQKVIGSAGKPASSPECKKREKNKRSKSREPFEMPPARLHRRQPELPKEQPVEIPFSDLIHDLLDKDEDRLFRESVPLEDPTDNSTVLLVKKEHREPCLVGIGRQKGMMIEISQTPFRIGKLKGETEYVIDSPVISRMHARITGELSGSVRRHLIEDLNSTNGTYVNGVRLSPYSKVTLRPGDVIRLADREYVFRYGSPTQPSDMTDE